MPRTNEIIGEARKLYNLHNRGMPRNLKTLMTFRIAHWEIVE